MNETLKIVLSLSLSGSILILILLLLRPVFKERLSKRWQYYIWLVVVARLLLPFAPETNLMGALFQGIDRGIAQTELFTPPMQQDGTSAPEVDLPTGNGATGEMDSPQSGSQEPTGTADNPAQNILLVIGQNLWLGWLVVALILFIRKITIYQSFVKYIRAGCVEVADIDLLERFGKLLEQNGVKTAVELQTNSLISSPLLIGFFRPCIVLPSANLSPTDFEYTILHELAHYKRRDMFYKWLVQFTICLHWFNPLTYIMGREISRTCELSCDESVIKKLNAKEQRIYGDTLLNAMGAGGDYKDSLASVTLTESKELLKERLDAIMIFKKKSLLTVLVSILLTFAFGFGASAVGAYAVSPSASHTTSQQGQQATEPYSTGTEKSKTEPVSYVIECVSEKIIVKQGGTDFKIEVDPANQDNYTIRDNRNVPMGERYYRYNKWDIVFSRNHEIPQSDIFSSTVTLTIPETLKEQELCLVTSSGNIQIENLKNVNLQIESKAGSISIENTNATDILAQSEKGNIHLSQITSTGDIVTHSDYGTVTVELDNSDRQYSVKISTEPKADITINGQSYSGGDFVVGAGGAQTITLDGENNAFALSNIRLFNTAVSNVSDRTIDQGGQVTKVYWTEQEFIGFMQEQEKQYKALLTSGDITQQEYDTFISTDKATLKEIQKGAKISKSATGSIDNGIGS